MTDYPYSFYVVGYNNIMDAVKWCSDKSKYSGIDSIDWKYSSFVRSNDQNQPKWLQVAKFDFADYKIAFEFALVWN